MHNGTSKITFSANVKWSIYTLNHLVHNSSIIFQNY